MPGEGVSEENQRASNPSILPWDWSWSISTMRLSF